jgi:SNF2 family DNA or RNA helicase
MITDQSKVFQFLSADLKQLKTLATVFLSDRISRMQAKDYRPSIFRLSYATGMLDVCFEDSSYTDEELSIIIRGLRKKTRYIKLNKDVILKIGDEDSEKLLNTVDEFNLDIRHLNRKQQIPSYQVMKLADKELDLVDHKGNDGLISLLSDIANYKEAPFDLPKEVEPHLRSYQKEAFLWMKTLVKYHFNGILADDMGLGKTLEMISVLLSDDEPKPTLIVCPKSLCFNWRNEFELWAKDMKVTNIIGSGPERMDMISAIDNISL